MSSQHLQDRMDEDGGDLYEAYDLEIASDEDVELLRERIEDNKDEDTTKTPAQ